ncbi:phosphoribosyltransferase [Candidatus Dependentiae bacterium]
MSFTKKHHATLLFSLLFSSGLLLGMEKKYIGIGQLQKDSFNLAKKIYTKSKEENALPTFLIVLWRGGAPVGIAVEEYFSYMGETIENHFPVRVSAYNQKNQLKKKVTVFDSESIFELLNSNDRLLIVDDVVDSGSSIEALLKRIKEVCGENTPKQIKVAAVYYKPKKSSIIPDYYVYETDQWIVFPHELIGLTPEEIEKNKGLDASLFTEWTEPQ